MSNTLPILGTNNIGLTFKLPRWDRRLKYNAGSVIIHDRDSDSDSVEYRLYMNPSVNKVPYADSETPIDPETDSDWKLIDFA